MIINQQWLFKTTAQVVKTSRNQFFTQVFTEKSTFVLGVHLNLVDFSPHKNGYFR
jgi:hypothetical protein